MRGQRRRIEDEDEFFEQFSLTPALSRWERGNVGADGW
jgi:hypothetical protein